MISFEVILAGDYFQLSVSFLPPTVTTRFLVVVAFFATAFFLVATFLVVDFLGAVLFLVATFFLAAGLRLVVAFFFVVFLVPNRSFIMLMILWMLFALV